MGNQVIRKLKKAASKILRHKKKDKSQPIPSQDKGKQVSREENNIEPVSTHDSDFDFEQPERYRPARRTESEERYAELVGLGSSKTIAQLGQESQSGFQPSPTTSP